MRQAVSEGGKCHFNRDFNTLTKPGAFRKICAEFCVYYTLSEFLLPLPQSQKLSPQKKLRADRFQKKHKIIKIIKIIVDKLKSLAYN